MKLAINIKHNGIHPLAVIEQIEHFDGNYEDFLENIKDIVEDFNKNALNNA